MSSLVFALGLWSAPLGALAEPAPVPAPAAPKAPEYKVTAQQEPLVKLRLDQGFARWVTRREAPNTLYSVQAPMSVDIYPDWVMIRTDGGEVHVVPREFLIYVGSQPLDEF